MKTSKPVSTISYNSVSFLKGKLEELYKAHIIEFWAFIAHKPEEDEAGLKPHCHVWIVPAKQIQTESLREEFVEIVPKELPRKCMPFHSSKKFDDWGLYSIHDSGYLAFKKQSRKYHYEWNDILSSDLDELNRYIYEIDFSKFNVYEEMNMAASSGMSFMDFASYASVPVQQINAYMTAWKQMVSDITDRNGRTGHDDYTWDISYLYNEGWIRNDKKKWLEWLL